jgi:hypothetical protein
MLASSLYDERILGMAEYSSYSNYYGNLESFGGYPVEEWQKDSVFDPKIAYRLTLDYDASEQGAEWSDMLNDFLDALDPSQVKALVVGPWDFQFRGVAPAEAVVEALVNASDKLSNLEVLFFGDIASDESEISWIENTDVSPLFNAYPKLQAFGVRGSNNLRLGHIDLPELKELHIYSGGLPVEVIRDIFASKLPSLTTLVLWLGSFNYGADSSIDDLLPLLNNNPFPKLTRLGLCNSEYTDTIAKTIVNTPILKQLRVLELSMGTLGDEGAQALLDSPALKQLEALVLSHHYCSDEMMLKLQQLGIKVDISAQQESWDGSDERYIAIAE